MQESVSQDSSARTSPPLLALYCAYNLQRRHTVQRNGLVLSREELPRRAPISVRVSGNGPGVHCS